MVGFSESQKVSAINKVFADSYKSPLSVIVVDNLERLLGQYNLLYEELLRYLRFVFTDWTSIGPRFSNSVLQALLVLLARRPPKVTNILLMSRMNAYLCLLGPPPSGYCNILTATSANRPWVR